ncbi:unnamed protein product [Rhizophagus irregularis]|nr:unnamed protein product [Rhizophagus irregularis]
MEQCWNANPLDRPDDIDTLFDKITFHSKLYDFNIPENIDDFGQSSKQNSKIISNIIKAGNDDEYNNPNLHSEEQEEFEIPNDEF